MKYYFYMLTGLRGLKWAVLPGAALLLGLGLFMGEPAFAQAEPGPELVIKDGQIELRNGKNAGGGLLDLNDYVGDAICYREDAAFILPCPDGWVGDPVAAERLGFAASTIPRATLSTPRPWSCIPG